MAGKTNKRSKSPDARPARARYWQNRTLRKRKIRNLMRNNHKLSEREATDLWEESRKGRMKK